jgi:hypothetical protein
MKKVFSNHDEVAHIWAQQSQEEGRAARIFFEGPTIYSYGRHFPVARFVDNRTVLFTTRDYSVSTGKHKSIISRAIPGFVEIFYVHDVDKEDHSSNVGHWIDNLFYQSEILRKGIKAKREERMAGIESGLKRLRTFMGRFEAKVPKESRLRWEFLSSAGYTSKEEYKKFLDRQAEIYAKIEEERKEAERRADAERLEKILEWKSGSDIQPPHTAEIHLRAKDDEIQTSWGARIPLKVAKKFWGLLKAEKNVGDFNFGHYQAHTFDGKVLHVGCHKIALTEMERLAAGLGW